MWSPPDVVGGGVKCKTALRELLTLSLFPGAWDWVGRCCLDMTMIWGFIQVEDWRKRDYPPQLPAPWASHETAYGVTRKPNCALMLAGYISDPRNPPNRTLSEVGHLLLQPPHALSLTTNSGTRIRCAFPGPHPPHVQMFSLFPCNSSIGWKGDSGFPQHRQVSRA